MIKAYKLYIGADGNTHVQTGTITEDIFNEVENILFKESPPHSSYDWHNAPRFQYVLTLLGTLEFKTFTGETFIIKPGEILIATDTTGTAHQWKLVNDEPWRRAYVAFKEGQEINFVPDKN